MTRKTIRLNNGKIGLDAKTKEIPQAFLQMGFKYRAVYVVDGVRIVGFDNERSKGDHCHIDGKEAPYAFTSVDQLLEDFIAAVETRRAS